MKDNRPYEPKQQKHPDDLLPRLKPLSPYGRPLHPWERAKKKSLNQSRNET